jgi:short-subunit dehydrogenase
LGEQLKIIQRIFINYNSFLCLFQTAKAFLPEMMATNKGHIVTVGSVTGLMGTYACTDYSATKFACIGFHESLFTELRVNTDIYGMLCLGYNLFFIFNRLTTTITST